MMQTAAIFLLPLATSSIAVVPNSISSSDITLVTFGDGDKTARKWREVNDPVMGGKSTGTWDVSNGIGVFDGDVVDVPFLSAPGFIKTSTIDTAPFADISSCSGLFVNARASTDFAGYRLSFGTKKSSGCSFFSGGFKAHFDAPVAKSFQRIELPFKNFSDCNSDATGEPSKTCASDSTVCPDATTLKDVKTVTIWAEGAKGKVHLEVQSIGATGCRNTETTTEPADCTTYNKLEEGTCAEACLPGFVGICPVALVVKEGGLQKGDCASLGYSTAAGSISQKAGPCGTITFQTFTKPSTLSRSYRPVPVTVASRVEAEDVVLATFDGAAETTHDWEEKNDPVMGGKSTGTFTVFNGTGHFKGEVVDVPSLQAPGFIKAQTQDKAKFADISSCSAIAIIARAGSPYDGYRFQFGNKRGLFCSFFSSGFKSHFDIPVSDTFQRVMIPLTNFSDCNSDSTGEPSKLCSDDQSVCPDTTTLQNVGTIAVWGEGSAGTVDLEIKSIIATGCTASSVSFARPVVHTDPQRESSANSDDIILATFVPGDSTEHTWTELNDPVMGGRSTGNFSVSSDNLGQFRGEVVNVPKLQAPGFIKAQTTDNVPFADISTCKSIVVNARAGAKYDGYRFQFGDKRGLFCSFFSSGFKSHFDAPVSDEIQRIEIPLGNFSDCNSDSTGEPSKLCSKDPSVCPDMTTLTNVKTIAIWAEGAAGTVHLDIKSIAATGCSAPVVAADPGFNGKNMCSGQVQEGLKYNMSGRTDAGLPFPLADGETLASGVCCDSAYASYAEPQFTFNRTDVNFFDTLEKQDHPITFYDSVCGIPLFRAPMNRTFEEFKAETLEHGWPSFRPAEVVSGNVKILENGYAVSKCGTHLGSNLPDEKGTRYCLDLSCVSGNPVTA